MPLSPRSAHRLLLFSLVVASSAVLASGGVAVSQNPAPQEVLAWPPPPAPARIKWVAQYRNAFDVGAKKKHSFLDRLAGRSESVLWLQRPISVAVDDEGVIYVGDFTQGVLAMDPVRHRMWAFSSVSGSALPTPTGLAVDSKLVFAASSNTNSVVAYDKEGHQIAALGPMDGINRPVGLAVDGARDLLVVVNGGEHAVRLYTRSMKLIRTIGSRGSEEGQFNFPTYCCLIPGTGFAVVDTGNFRIQIFDYEGRFLRAFGKVGDNPGSFARPKGIGVDSDGHLYVVDAAFSNFQILQQDGRSLTFVGQGGTGRGQFQAPTDLTVTKGNAIYVVDQINDRIQQFQYLPAPAEGPLPQAERPIPPTPTSR